MYQEKTVEREYLEKVSAMTPTDRQKYLEREATAALGKKNNLTFLSEQSLDNLRDAELLERTIRYFR